TPTTVIVVCDRSSVADTHHMTSRRAWRIGINSDQRQIDRRETGFLGEFTGGGVLCCLAVFDIPAGQRVLTLERRMSSTNKQQPASRGEKHPLAGEGGVLGDQGGCLLGS